MHRSLAESAQRQEAAGQPSILLVTPPIRPWLAKLVRHSIPGLQILAYNEIPDNKQIKVVANIGTDAPSRCKHWHRRTQPGCTAEREHGGMSMAHNNKDSGPIVLLAHGVLK
jgi:hypothetical protein